MANYRRSESAFRVEAFIAIIFQSQHSEHRRSESAFRAYDSSGVCVSHSPSRPIINVQSQRSEHRRSESAFRA